MTNEIAKWIVQQAASAALEQGAALGAVHIKGQFDTFLACNPVMSKRQRTALRDCLAGMGFTF